MNFELSYILAPALGGIIGYITNDIAIRMLFRPRQAKYICGIHIPFTPGIIPKEKGRIAEAVGGVISENLINKEVLEKYLLSEDMVGKVRSAVDEFIIVTQQKNNETTSQFLGHFCQKKKLIPFHGTSTKASPSRLMRNWQTVPWEKKLLTLPLTMWHKS